MSEVQTLKEKKEKAPRGAAVRAGVPWRPREPTFTCRLRDVCPSVHSCCRLNCSPDVRGRKCRSKKKMQKNKTWGIQPLNRGDGATTERTEQRKQSNLIIIISSGAPKKGHGWQVEEKEWGRGLSASARSVTHMTEFPTSLVSERRSGSSPQVSH